MWILTEDSGNSHLPRRRPSLQLQGFVRLRPRLRLHRHHTTSPGHGVLGTSRLFLRSDSVQSNAPSPPHRPPLHPRKLPLAALSPTGPAEQPVQADAGVTEPAAHFRGDPGRWRCATRNSSSSTTRWSYSATRSPRALRSFRRLPLSLFSLPLPQTPSSPSRQTPRRSPRLLRTLARPRPRFPLRARQPVLFPAISHTDSSSSVSVKLPHSSH